MKSTAQEMNSIDISIQLRNEGYSDLAISKLFENSCHAKRSQYFSKNLIVQVANRIDCKYILDRINECITVFGSCSVGDLEYILTTIPELGRIINLSIIPEIENHNHIGWDSPIKYDGYRNDTKKLCYLYLPYPKNLSSSEVSNEVSTEQSLFDPDSSVTENVLKIRRMFKDLEIAINDICPEKSQDKDFGLIYLENAYMGFYQAIIKANS